MNVTAVIVTFNRKDLLRQCLQALVSQSRKPDRLLIVDNASNDGTASMLAEAGWLARDDIELLSLAENTGGAGGFAAGMRRAAERGSEWLWIMDDDALPEPDALSRLTEARLDREAIYASLAVDRGVLAWPLTTENGGRLLMVETDVESPEPVEIKFAPFLGLFLHASLIRQIGLPDEGYFIAADDVEYCLRARSKGVRIYAVPGSRIKHPAPRCKVISMLGVRITHLHLPPWKRYYDTRNRILVARSHHGIKLLTHTLPGTLFRLLYALLAEPNRTGQLKAFVGGTVDGLLSRKGRRHARWGISA